MADERRWRYGPLDEGGKGGVVDADNVMARRLLHAHLTLTCEALRSPEMELNLGSTTRCPRFIINSSLCDMGLCLNWRCGFLVNQ